MPKQLSKVLVYFFLKDTKILEPAWIKFSVLSKDVVVKVFLWNRKVGVRRIHDAGCVVTGRNKTSMCRLVRGKDVHEQRVGSCPGCWEEGYQGQPLPPAAPADVVVQNVVNVL
jgi:hypothetical protein